MKKTIPFSLVILILFIVIGCNNQNNLIEKNKEIAKKLFAAWSSHDSIKLASLFTDNLIYHDTPFGLESKTKQQLVNFVNVTIKAVPDAKIVPSNMVASEDFVMVTWTWTGTYIGGWGPDYPGNSKPFSINGMSVLEIENGLIKNNYDYYDKDPFRKLVALP